MARASAGAVDQRAKCEAPPEEFIAFAKGLMTPRAAPRLQALAQGPVADLFARRLVSEALSGAPHALSCLKQIGELGKEASWAARLHAGDAAGEPPPPQSLAAKELEPAARGIRVLSPQQALGWLAGAYLQAAGKTVAALETLLLEAAPTARALAAALDAALASSGTPLTGSLAGRVIGALERHAAGLASVHGGRESPLLQLAKSAKGKQAARLVSSLTRALLAEEEPQSAGCPSPAPAAEPAAAAPVARPAPTRGVAEAAWSAADEALGRALQEMDFLARSFERLESAAQGEAAERARRTRNASKLVLQWVEQAAHCRRVAVLNKAGDRVPFDPAFHELYGRADIGAPVRIVKPAVVRGTEPEQVVLLRAEAELD
jgi:hypothetical protein